MFPLACLYLYHYVLAVGHQPDQDTQSTYGLSWHVLMVCPGLIGVPILRMVCPVMISVHYGLFLNDQCTKSTFGLS